MHSLPKYKRTFLNIPEIPWFYEVTITLILKADKNVQEKKNRPISWSTYMQKLSKIIAFQTQKHIKIMMFYDAECIPGMKG